MIAGLKYGYVDPKDMNAKKEHYELVQKLVERFKEENGSNNMQRAFGTQCGS